MSAHYRLRSLDTDSSASSQPPAMEPPQRHSASPEDCSDANETSAPSEFLAEFLSAIMRRQYAEALKYCRLILQYEPHNATARGFYPLLQHKLLLHKRADEEWVRSSSSEEASPPLAPPDLPERMQQGGDSSSGASEGSCCSSLELDSSPSVSLSRRTERTDSPSLGCCDTSVSRSDTDDNGNARPCVGDVVNDNAPSDLKAESSSLRRLRAQFACSIK